MISQSNDFAKQLTMISQGNFEKTIISQSKDFQETGIPGNRG